jgi:hypothetical protein
MMALSVEEVEMLRRSHAMAPLRPDDVAQLLESCAELAAERRELIRVLQRLRHTFPAVRQALNEIATIIALPSPPPPSALTSLDHADHVSARQLNRRRNDGSPSRE